MNEISVYPAGLHNIIPIKEVTIQDVAIVIRSEKYKAITEYLRTIKTEAEETIYKKTKFEYATFSGTFTKRAESGLKEYSGYLCIDIDKVTDKKALESLKANILVTHTPALLFVSPRGKGLKIVYSIDLAQGSHEQYFEAFKGLFAVEFHKEIDPAPANVASACLLCYDPECFFSENPTLFGKDLLKAFPTQVIQLPVKSEFEQNDRPGDIYNNSSDAISEMKDLLSCAGWKENCKGWIRPGKTEGISATLGKVAPNVFYNFSSEAAPFEPNKAYFPFQVLALLKFNSDFTEAAKYLSDIQRPTALETRNTMPETHESPDFLKLLEAAKINLSEELPEPQNCLQLVDGYNTATIATLGNFMLIIGKAKSRKTFFMIMALAAIVRDYIVLNRIKGCLPEGKKAALYFDTEQSRYHVQKAVKRVCKLSGIDVPVNFNAYGLRKYKPSERMQLIEYAIYNTPGLGFVVIDGVRDLVTSINDEEQSTMMASKLLKWTEELNIHIVVVLHQNKADNNARGHLGSELVNKAETVLSITKDEKNKDISIVEAEYCRDIEPESFAFNINDEGLPCIISDWQPGKKDASKKELSPSDIDVTTHKEILNTIFEIEQKQSFSTLSNQLKLELKKCGIPMTDKMIRLYITHYQNEKLIQHNGTHQTRNAFYTLI